MKALYIISHNAVLVRDGSGRRSVVTGKGIGFMKGKGDRINQDLIQNVFIEDQCYINRKMAKN